jgi:hypothetical protein
MKSEVFRELLEKHNDYFIQIHGDSTMYQGNKVSIQGKTIDDAMYLYDNLIALLGSTKSNFKFGTNILINCDNEEQKTKLLTIYVPDNVDTKSFAELVYLNIKDYEGGEDIPTKKSYTHYKNAIYYRNDRDEDGNYIPA